MQALRMDWRGWVSPGGRLVSVMEWLEPRRLLSNDWQVVAPADGGSLFGGTETSIVEEMVVQPDGKMLVVWGGDLVRLNVDMTLDSTFAAGGVYNLGNLAAQSMVVLPDGSGVLVAGQHYGYYNLGAEAAVIKLRPDGTLDPSFASGGTAVLPRFRAGNAVATELGVAADGSITAAVSVQSTYPTDVGYRVGLARLNSDGSVDRSFGVDGVSALSLGDDQVYRGDAVVDMDVSADGRVALTTSGELLQNTFGANRLLRFDADGQLIGSFDAGSPGFKSVVELTQVKQLPTGDLLVNARLAGGDMSLWRLSNGRLTALPFGLPADLGVYAQVTSLELNAAGHVVVSGFGQNWTMAFTEEVTLEGQAIDARVMSLHTLYPHGVVAAGSDGSLFAALRRGVHDRSFGSHMWAKHAIGNAVSLPVLRVPDVLPPYTGLTPEQIRLGLEQDTTAWVSSEVLADGKRLVLMDGVGSEEPQWPWDTAPAVVQLNADGSLDADFGNGGISVLPAAMRRGGVLKVTSDRILVGGSGSEDPAVISGEALDPAVAALRRDGTLDRGYDTDGYAIFGDVSSGEDRVVQIAVDAGNIYYLGIQVSYGAERSDTGDLAVARTYSVGHWERNFYGIQGYGRIDTQAPGQAGHDRMISLQVTSTGLDITLDNGVRGVVSLNGSGLVTSTSVDFGVEEIPGVLQRAAAETRAWYLASVRDPYGVQVVEVDDGYILALRGSCQIDGKWEYGAFAIKLRLDGVPDTGFGSGGILKLASDTDVYAAVRSDDGRVWVAVSEGSNLLLLGFDPSSSATLSFERIHLTTHSNNERLVNARGLISSSEGGRLALAISFETQGYPDYRYVSKLYLVSTGSGSVVEARLGEATGSDSLAVATSLPDGKVVVAMRTELGRWGAVVNLDGSMDTTAPLALEVLRCIENANPDVVALRDGRLVLVFQYGYSKAIELVILSADGAAERRIIDIGLDSFQPVIDSVSDDGSITIRVSGLGKHLFITVSVDGQVSRSSVKPQFAAEQAIQLHDGRVLSFGTVLLSTQPDYEFGLTMQWYALGEEPAPVPEPEEDVVVIPPTLPLDNDVVAPAEGEPIVDHVSEPTESVSPNVESEPKKAPLPVFGPELEKIWSEQAWALPRISEVLTSESVDPLDLAEASAALSALLK